MAASLPILAGENGLSRYLDEIRRFPMLQPQEEYMLAKSWREHSDSAAAHRLVTSHLRLVAKIAMGYRGYGLPVGEVISEGNIGLMQAVKRFEPEKGFRLATYAMWWIRASIQEYILRSWSLVKMGTTANQKKLFFNLRKAKSQISAFEEGDLRPENVQAIATKLGVSHQEVIDMNRRLSGDASLNAPLREEGEGEWQDWLVDTSSSQESLLVESEEADNRRAALSLALGVLNDRERRIFEARRLSDDPITLEDLSTEFGISRERVRQIEVRAFEKVQQAVRDRVARVENLPRPPLPLAARSEGVRLEPGKGRPDKAAFFMGLLAFPLGQHVVQDFFARRAFFKGHLGDAAVGEAHREIEPVLGADHVDILLLGGGGQPDQEDIRGDIDGKPLQGRALGSVVAAHFRDVDLIDGADRHIGAGQEANGHCVAHGERRFEVFLDQHRHLEMRVRHLDIGPDRVGQLLIGAAIGRIPPPDHRPDIGFDAARFIGRLHQDGGAIGHRNDGRAGTAAGRGPCRPGVADCFADLAA